MSKSVFRVAVVALIALSVGSQGCMGWLFQWGKHEKLKKEYQQLANELERKDSQLADDQGRIASLKEQVDSMNHIVTLYKEKKKEAERLAAQTRAELDKHQTKLDKIAGRHQGAERIPGGIALKDQLLFALGSAEISEKGKKALQDIATEFKGADVILQIDGHTDDHRVAKPETVKRFIDNWGLSGARSAAVLRLLAKFGIAERRMYTRAFSMHKPRVPNANEASRSKNRRVEIMFLPTAAPGAAPAKKK